MSSPSQSFYITTPIYYVNARPHIGHAYSTLVCDAIARRQRLLGNQVFFLTGTDEHGQKIERSAARAGQSPQAFADTVSAQFRGLWDRMGITYDDFIRTTEPRHQRGVQHLFADLLAKGFIYKGTYTGQYCVSDEAWVEALPDGTCPDCGRPTETVSEENYFFKLSAFEHTLLSYYESHPDFIRPAARRNEVISFVRSGLKDLSISRTSFKWGIPVPGDERHVIYVWMDALANYVTALGYGSNDQSKLNQFWPANIHLIGKEISRFHCVYWPAFLLAAGLPLPQSIVANGWLLFDETKMSKSLGNVVRAETILDVFGELGASGTDALRYFLFREIVFGQDGSFTFDNLVRRYNADLANGYGNLASRTLTMIHKYFAGAVPTPTAPAEAPELAIAAAAESAIADFTRLFDAQQFSLALESLWSFVATIDGYITSNAPWKLGALSDEASQRRLAAILYTCAESLRIVTALVYPILPDSAAKIFAQLGLGDIQDAISSRELASITWGTLKSGTQLGEIAPIFPRADKDAATRMSDIEQKNTPAPADSAAPTSAPAPAPAPAAKKETLREKFESIEASIAVALAESTSESAAVVAFEETFLGPAEGSETAEAQAAAAPATPAPPAIPQISIEDFIKVELRVAQILVAERIPKADKLLRLEVDLGYEKRQILAGIAQYYTPESLIGRKVVIVANLAPRKMRGLESNGMIVAASLGDAGKPVLAGFLEDVEIGARLK